MKIDGNPITARRGAIDHALDTVDAWQFREMVRVLMQARQQRWTVYTAGNGGSAANAQHLTLHLRQCGLRVVDLTANAPLLTAISNDSEYAECFAQQVRGQLHDGDVIFAISGSGNSPNILRLLETEPHLTHRLGLLGFGGGQARALCHHHVTLASHAYAVVEDVHSALIHLIQEALTV